MKVNGVEHTFPIPGQKDEDNNFPNSGGLQYEAQSVRECLITG